MRITSNFDSGNIEVVNIDDSDKVFLKIRKDTNAESFQWFYFRVTGAANQLCTFSIENAGEASYPEGWQEYSAVASYDRTTWFRVPSYYEDGKLIIEHFAEENTVFYAYFAPFTYEQHLNLIQNACESYLCEYESLGLTTENRDIDLLKIGEESKDKKKIWIIARQHAGESMSEWFMQGLIYRLLDESDPVSRKVLEKACFYLVPSVNVDGAIAGNIRTNAAGRDLNREWGNPDKQNAPEVYAILDKMNKTGLDLNLDIHGDEGLAYNFISGIEGIPSYDAKLKSLTEKFFESWLRVSPDFQTEHGYPKNEPGKANLNICSKAIGEKFRKLSLTIEMPFKDNHNLPDDIFGWSPERSENFGSSLVNVVYELIDDL